MSMKRWLYASTGLLSLLGFIGVFTQARVFWHSFAFAVDFEYFFIKSDEMMEEYMNKSASRAFLQRHGRRGARFPRLFHRRQRRRDRRPHDRPRRRVGRRPSLSMRSPPPITASGKNGART